MYGDCSCNMMLWLCFEIFTLVTSITEMKINYNYHITLLMKQADVGATYQCR
jgi:hypothetical protein